MIARFCRSTVINQTRLFSASAAKTKRITTQQLATSLNDMISEVRARSKATDEYWEGLVADIRKEVTRLCVEMGELRGGLGDLPEDVGELRAEVKQLRAKVGRPREDVRWSRAEVEWLRAEVRGLETKVERLADVSRNHERQLKPLIASDRNLDIKVEDDANDALREAPVTEDQHPQHPQHHLI